jgi:hypothetical protein
VSIPQPAFTGRRIRVQRAKEGEIGYAADNGKMYEGVVGLLRGGFYSLGNAGRAFRCVYATPEHADMADMVRTIEWSLLHLHGQHSEREHACHHLRQIVRAFSEES